MNLKPLGDRVVIEHVEQAEKSAGGVFLPDTAKEKPQEGMILAVGPGRVLDNGNTVPPEREGRRPAFTRSTRARNQIDGKEYLIVSEKDVLFVAGVPAGVK